MSNKQQTAVEWLEEKLIESGVNLLRDEIEFINQAKELEKQQIIDARQDGMNAQRKGYGVNNEQYYNETYEQ